MESFHDNASQARHKNETPYRHVERQTRICALSRPERALGDSGVLPLELAEPEAAEDKCAVGHRALQKRFNLFVYVGSVGLEHNFYLKSHQKLSLARFAACCL
jgi:hypothetical protein